MCTTMWTTRRRGRIRRRGAPAALRDRPGRAVAASPMMDGQRTRRSPHAFALDHSGAVPGAGGDERPVRGARNGRTRRAARPDLLEFHGEHRAESGAPASSEFLRRSVGAAIHAPAGQAGDARRRTVRRSVVDGGHAVPPRRISRDDGQHDVDAPGVTFPVELRVLVRLSWCELSSGHFVDSA